MQDSLSDSDHSENEGYVGKLSPPDPVTEVCVVATAPVAAAPKKPKPRPQKKERTEAAPAGAKPAKAAKVRDGVEDLALNWLKQNNKPVTTQSMADALQSKVSKPVVQKALDTLCEQGLIVSKDLKKVKVFYLDQTQLKQQNAQQSAVVAVDVDSSVAQTAGDADASDASAETILNREDLVKSILFIEPQLRQVSEDLAKSRREMTLQDLNTRVDLAKEKLSALQLRLDSAMNSSATARHAASNSSSGDALNMRAAVSRYYTARNLWRQRKTMANSILDRLVGERVWSEVVQDFGLTLDEDCGVSLDGCCAFVPEKFRCK
jgi:26S proteasome regulatory subunit (ATPase 3-interacting protein)